MLFCTAVLSILLIFSCDLPQKDPPDVVDADVNPVFEMHPPVASSIGIQLLKNDDRGNLLVTANFDKMQLKASLHAINLSSGKVILRDDGKVGDVKAQDGIFSIILKEDLDVLQQELKELDKNKDRFPKESPFEFRGRHVVRADFTALRKFDFERFLEGELTILPKNWICHLLHDVSIPHSLFVTNVNTVEDPTRTALTPCTTPSGAPGGAWTFEKLIADMANTPMTGISAEDFVKDWLSKWLSDQFINGETVSARTNLFNRVIEPWVINSGSTAGTFTIDNWQSRPLNLAKAPFKLIAIVNRLDLRGNMGYGMSNAGEGRFIFEVLNPTTCVPLPGPFMVIFEYGIPIRGCTKLKEYGQRWYNLKNLPLGSATYNDSLQQLTDVFAAANAAPTRTNGSAINQIRTNERTIGTPWELREFVLDPSNNKLMMTTVKQEPAEIYNEVADHPGTAADVDKLRDWINTHQSLILQDKHIVPDSLPTGEPFLGGKAHSEPGFWQVSGVSDPEARHHFSLNTCSGCHRQETGTLFVHIGEVPLGTPFGTEAPLSGFLTGISHTDPVNPPTSHDFNDLLRRQQSLEGLLCNTCTNRFRELIEVLRFEPMRMVH